MLVINLLIGFIGYIIGRISHIFGGKVPVPHHWIFGFGLILIGLVWREFLYGWQISFFGIGLFISDLRDFWYLKVMEPDSDEKKRFWHID